MAGDLQGVNIELQSIDQRIKNLADVTVADIASIYVLGEELGRGRFSIVQSAEHIKEKAKYAVKVVENASLDDEENLEALETEIAILRKLKHPHIVELKEVVTTDENTYIVMELLSGGELFNRIVQQTRFSEKEGAELFAQILLSMEYLHSLNIVHRDVKPENILYIESGANDIKLIDFGYAGVYSDDKPLTGLCGTPDYVAPEVLTWYDDDDNGTPYGKGSDLWSLGVLLYVILSGCSPFSAEEEEQLLKQVAEAKYVFFENEWADVSAEAKDLIRGLLVVDPAQRLTMEQVLSHPWLKEAADGVRAQIADKTAQTAAASGGGGANGGKPAAPAAQNGKPGGTQPVVQTDMSGKGEGCCRCSLM